MIFIVFFLASQAQRDGAEDEEETGGADMDLEDMEESDDEPLEDEAEDEDAQDVPQSVRMHFTWFCENI